ncbi:MAG: GAF domain-containing protein [Chloroflexi bacterium]|nr:GAF domain-containing protein [Chloroflexota bacterium]
MLETVLVIDQSIEDGDAIVLDKIATFLLRQWNGLRTLSLEHRVRLLRQILPLVFLVGFAFYQTAIHALFETSINWRNEILEWIGYGLPGAFAIWLGLGWMANTLVRQDRDALKLEQASTELAQIYQRLSAMHEMGRQAVSAVDPLQVYQLAAQAPTQIAGARGAAVLTFDDADALKLEMTWGLGEQHVAALYKRAAEGIPPDRCRGCVPLTARVNSNCPLFVGTQAQAQSDGIASLVCIPLTRGTERVGIISSYFGSSEGPPQAQLALLNVAAAEIAAALEGARLRAQQMAALSTVEQTPPDANLDKFLTQVLSAIRQGWQGEASALFVYDAAAQAWTQRAHHGLGEDLSDPRLDVAMRLSEQARATNRPALWSREPSDERVPFDAAIAVPLHAEGQVLGALFLTLPRAWSARQMPLVDFMAQQTALAVRNAQLHQQLGHVAMLEERHRLSREMHDGVAQTLGYLGWQMDHLTRLAQSGQTEALTEELVAARRNVREAYMDAREAIDGLRLAVDHPGGLPAALEQYAADFTARSGIATQFSQSGCSGGLSPVAELQLLRFAQEALTNVRKHSGAQNVQILLSCDAKTCQLSIGDDGRGFDALMPRSRNHWGMTTMRERVQSLGGYLTITTNPGQGTRLTATVPVTRTDVRSST